MDVREEQPVLEQAQSGHHGQPEGQDTGSKEQKGQGGRLSQPQQKDKEQGATSEGQEVQ